MEELQPIGDVLREWIEKQAELHQVMHRGLREMVLDQRLYARVGHPDGSISMEPMSPLGGRGRHGAV